MAGRKTEQTGVEPLVAFRETLEAACAQYGLTVLGIVPEEQRSIVLVGLRSDAWPHLTQSAEFMDRQTDPLDRWSMRILPIVASQVGAAGVVYPFGGPPYEPFIRWAFESGETFASPVGMLVHHRAGFWISFRGALIFDQDMLPLSPSSPCRPCPKPCETACPVGALAPGQEYDVPACKAHLASPEGRACLDGCLVRRACPVSQEFGRDPEQSAFHMRAFVGA